MAQNFSQSKKPFLFLDTNIIIYRNQTWTEKQLEKELVDLETLYKLAISKVTRYEILKNSDVRKGSKLLDLLNLFESFEITEEVLIVAALLYRLFKENKEKNVQDADVIIAAAAFLNKSFVLTTNRSDFPYPYFDELRITPILYRREPFRTDCLLLCLLKPNTQLIIHKIGAELKL